MNFNETNQKIIMATEDLSKNVTNLELSFSRVIANYLMDIGKIEDFSECSFFKEELKIKINGFSFEDDLSTVYLLVSHFENSFGIKKKYNDFSQELISNCQNFAKKSLDGFYKELLNGSEEKKLAKKIYDNKNKIKKISINLITNLYLPETKKTLSREVNGIEFEKEVWDLERIDTIQQNDGERESISFSLIEDFDIDPLKCIKTSSSSEIDTYLTAINGKVLADIYEKFGSRLLEFNVRSFLQDKVMVNKGIKHTIINEPSKFVSYNNGISIIVDDIESLGENDNIISIDRFNGIQIINGGQTTASIHTVAYKDKDLESVRKITVPLKINHLKRGNTHELSENITKFANTQNQIKQTDLTSRNPFNVEVEKIFETTKLPGEHSKRWFFERMRGDYTVRKLRAFQDTQKKKQFLEETPPDRKMQKEEVAKMYMCQILFPYIASRGNQKNYFAFTDHTLAIMKAKKLNTNFVRNIISTFIIFNELNKIQKIEGIEGYISQTSNYTLSYLFHITNQKLDLSEVWNNQGISTYLNKLLSKWVIKINQRIRKAAGEQNIGEWAKKKECWDDIKTLSLELPNQIPYEFRYTKFAKSNNMGKSKEEINTADKLLKKIQGYSPSQLENIYKTCREDRLITNDEIGALRVIIFCATAKWNQEPSVQHLLKAGKVLDRFNKEYS